MSPLTLWGQGHRLTRCLAHSRCSVSVCGRKPGEERQRVPGVDSVPWEQSTSPSGGPAGFRTQLIPGNDSVCHLHFLQLLRCCRGGPWGLTVSVGRPSQVAQVGDCSSQPACLSGVRVTRAGHRAHRPTAAGICWAGFGELSSSDEGFIQRVEVMVMVMEWRPGCRGR